jgi:hypothetical protein
MFDGVGRERWKRESHQLDFPFFFSEAQNNNRTDDNMKLTEWQNNGGWNRLKYRYYTYAVEFFLGCVGLAQ